MDGGDGEVTGKRAHLTHREPERVGTRRQLERGRLAAALVRLAHLLERVGALAVRRAAWVTRAEEEGVGVVPRVVGRAELFGARSVREGHTVGARVRHHDLDGDGCQAETVAALEATFEEDLAARAEHAHHRVVGGHKGRQGHPLPSVAVVPTARARDAHRAVVVAPVEGLVRVAAALVARAAGGRGAGVVPTVEACLAPCALGELCAAREQPHLVVVARPRLVCVEQWGGGGEEMPSCAARVVQVAQRLSRRVALEPRAAVLERALVVPPVVAVDGSVRRAHVRILVLGRALHA
eukprot:scaffold4105_cov63-Phaeocystis_antarctica.AAC.6